MCVKAEAYHHTSARHLVGPHTDTNAQNAAVPDAPFVFLACWMEEIEGGGGGVQPERSDACNDNAASLTWIALHQLLIAAPDILVVCLSNVSLFLSGGPRPTHQIRGNCWGQGLTQYTLQSEGGLETNLINGGYSPSYLDGANKKKQTNGLQRPSREESCGPLSSKLDPFRCLSTRLPGRHQTWYSSLRCSPYFCGQKKRNKRVISRLSLVVWIGQRDPNWKPVDFVCFVVLYRVADVRYRRKEWFVMQTKSRSEWQYVTDRFGFSRVALSIPSRHKPSINWAA